LQKAKILIELKLVLFVTDLIIKFQGKDIIKNNKQLFRARQ